MEKNLKKYTHTRITESLCCTLEINTILLSQLNFNILFYLFIWPYHAACGILVPQPGIEPGPLTVKTRSPNHWTTREFPSIYKKMHNDDNTQSTGSSI